MNRRDILRYTAWVTGSAVSLPLTSLILSGCSDSSNNAGGEHAVGAGELPVLHYFAPDQFKQLALLCDTILPRTDSPSATDVSVHVTMDSMLGNVFDDEYKAEFKTLWYELEAHLSKQGFPDLESSSRVELLRNLELSDDGAHGSARKALLEVKQQAIAYYLTTEEVAENYLNYLPIPGKYEPCISVDDVNNRAWAI